MNKTCTLEQASRLHQLHFLNVLLKWLKNWSN